MEIEVANEKRIVFDSFSLDLSNECLWRDEHAIMLRYSPASHSSAEVFVHFEERGITPERLNLELICQGKIEYVGTARSPMTAAGSRQQAGQLAWAAPEPAAFWQNMRKVLLNISGSSQNGPCAPSATMFS